jgi:hypothetical protein
MAEHVGIESDLSITPIEETPEYLEEIQRLISYLKKVARPAPIRVYMIEICKHVLTGVADAADAFPPTTTGVDHAHHPLHND